MAIDGWIERRGQGFGGATGIGAAGILVGTHVDGTALAGDILDARIAVEIGRKRAACHGEKGLQDAVLAAIGKVYVALRVYGHSRGITQARQAGRRDHPVRRIPFVDHAVAGIGEIDVALAVNRCSGGVAQT